jgi:hypothetical protein
MATCQNPKCCKDFAPSPKATTQKYCSVFCRTQKWNADHPSEKYQSTKAGAKRKADQLGMEFGKANRVLHKMMFFELAKRLELDSCFRCGKKIETLREFSLDHKLKWLDVSAELFWDLANIAFSHLACNISDGSKNFTEAKSAALQKGRSKLPRYAANAPEGLAWCSGHKQYLPTDRFHKSKRSATGTQSYCKECSGKFYDNDSSYDGSGDTANAGS